MKRSTFFAVIIVFAAVLVGCMPRKTRFTTQRSYGLLLILLLINGALLTQRATLPFNRCLTKFPASPVGMRW